MIGNNEAPAQPLPRDSIELVASAFEAWNRGDIERFADHMAEDVAWLELSGRPEAGDSERRGRDRLRQSLESLFESWESYSLEVERLHEAGGRIVAVVREVARGRASGLEIDGRWGYLITVGDGRIARVEAYRDPGLALRAAGIPEHEIGA
jgi:ketosteroid isomerase-like protein